MLVWEERLAAGGVHQRFRFDGARLYCAAMSQAQLFPATRWTLVLESRNSPSARRGALEELLSVYWKPLYVYARRCGCSDSDAQDAVQGLCARLIEREFLAQLDPERGRLRSYLRTAMRNYLANEHERSQAVKRGGGSVTLVFDDEIDESILDNGCRTPDAAYDRAWALTVVQRALDRLEREHRTSRQRTPFEVVACFFDPDREPPKYEDVAARLAISPGMLRVAIHRARARFKVLIEEEAADTMSADGGVTDEVGALLESLRG